MSAVNLKTWSERQQVLAIIILAGALIASLWYFLLMPMNRKRRSLEEDVRTLKASLERGGYLQEKRVLERRKESEYSNYRSLHSEWTASVNRLSAFGNDVSADGAHVDHIAFKVALFEVRDRLLEKSRDLGISVPENLGIHEEVYSHDDARVRMLQLRMVERLVDLLLDLKVVSLKSIEPLYPIEYKDELTDEVFIEEFPVSVEFVGNLSNLYDLFGSVFDSDRMFTLRNMRLESEEKGSTDLLNVKAVMSGLVFKLEAQELQPVPKAERRYDAPVGF